jgi:hypothetical protein
VPAGRLGEHSSALEEDVTSYCTCLVEVNVDNKQAGKVEVSRVVADRPDGTVRGHGLYYYFQRLWPCVQFMYLRNAQDFTATMTDMLTVACSGDRHAQVCDEATNRQLNCTTTPRTKYCGVCSEPKDHVFCYGVVVLFELCSQRGSSRVYLHDVSVMQLR